MSGFGGWIRLGKECPVCGGVRKDCRKSEGTKLVHCRDSSANPIGWTFLRTDKIGFGIWGENFELEKRNEERREEWHQEKERERRRLRERERRRLREREQRERLSKLLSIEERDRQYRKLRFEILNQAYLSGDHLSQLRERRRLTDVEIDFAFSKGWIFTWQPGMPVPGLSLALAGTKISKDGKTVLGGAPGIAIAARDINGRITGFQIGADNNKFGKYIWLSSSSHGGNGPQLPNGELPLFFNRHPEAKKIKEIWLVEGALKSLIVALILWCRHDRKDILVVGTPSNGDFSIGANQIKEAIALVGNVPVYFCPDAGAIENPNLVGSAGGYTKTFTLLKQIGCKVKIKWWNQKTKRVIGIKSHTQRDIDEILAHDKDKVIGDIPLEKFLAEIPDKGKQSPPDRRRKSRLIGREEWLNRKSLDNFQSLYKAIIDRFKPEEKPELKPKECLAIVPYRGVETLTLDNSNDLPDYKDWVEMGEPTIYFKDGSQRKELLIAAKEKGYRAVLDSSGVGLGKSHQCGELKRSDFNLQKLNDKGEDEGGRIVYIGSDYKNPTTSTVEENFTELIHRHNGESLDPSRTTPMGKAYRRNTPEGKVPDIPGNCPETQTFLKAAEEKDAMIFGGKDSPICSRCPRLNNCDFLETRKAQLRSKYNLRAHIDSLGQLSEKDVAIVDEPGASLKPTKSIDISLKEIESLGFRLQQTDPQAYSLISPFLEMIWKKFSTLKTIQNGYSMTETLAILAGDTDQLTIDIWKRYRKLGEAFEHPVVGELRAKLEKAYPDADPWEVPGISDLGVQISKAISNDWDKIFEGCQTPEQKQQAIQDKASLNWLSHLLKAITEQNRSININITENGKIKITRPSSRHKRTLQSAGYVILLDATASKQDLKRKTGFKHILEIKQQQPDNAYQNLRIRLVNGLGKNPKGTSDESTWKRYIAAIEALIQKQPGLSKEQRAIISFKKSLDRFANFDAIAGYWHGDTRGNNRFRQVLQLIVHGLPKPNLADKAAEWQAHTGQLVEPTDIAKTRYGAWYWSEVLAELIQCCGRPRAHLRPNEQIEISLMAGDALTDRDISILRQKFPGCAIEIIDTYDLTPAAASKGKQKKRGLLEIACQMVRETGDASRQKIAEILSCHPSRVSQLAKEATGKTFRELVGSLVFLYRAIEENLTLSDLDLNEAERKFAEQNLPLFAEDLENPDLALEAATCLAGPISKISLASRLKVIFFATEPWVLCKLFAGLMRVALNHILADPSPPILATG